MLLNNKLILGDLELMNIAQVELSQVRSTKPLPLIKKSYFMRRNIKFYERSPFPPQYFHISEIKSLPDRPSPTLENGDQIRYAKSQRCKTSSSGASRNPKMQSTEG